MLQVKEELILNLSDSQTRGGGGGWGGTECKEQSSSLYFSYFPVESKMFSSYVQHLVPLTL